MIVCGRPPGPSRENSFVEFLPPRTVSQFSPNHSWQAMLEETANLASRDIRSWDFDPHWRAKGWRCPFLGVRHDSRPLNCLQLNAVYIEMFGRKQKQSSNGEHFAWNNEMFPTDFNQNLGTLFNVLYWLICSLPAALGRFFMLINTRYDDTGSLLARARDTSQSAS